jgi:hypothetical protein
VDPRLRFLSCLIALGASFGVGLLVFPAANDRPFPAGNDRMEPSVRPAWGPIMAQGSDIVPIETPAKSPAEPTSAENRPTESPPQAQPKSEPSKAELLKPRAVGGTEVPAGHA